MKILITGGAGFIGSSLALHLIDRGHEVTVLDSLSPQIHGADGRKSALFRRIDGKVRFIEASVTNAAVWPEALNGQDAVVHLAAETGTGQSMYELHRYAEVNVGGTALLLQHLAQRQGHGVRRLVVASSRSLYGEGRYRATDGALVYPSARSAEDLRAGRFDLYDSQGHAMEMLPTDEESRIHPSSVYGITKQTQEQLVMTMGRALGIAPTALRYQNVYGPGQSLTNPYTGILSIFSTRILHGRGLSIFEDGLESRDFVYIDDVVAATAAALFESAAEDEVFGIGSGVATSVMEAARTLIAALGREVPVEVTGAFRVGDIRHNVADLSKARRLLGYEPHTPFAVGIERFAAWVRTQPLPDDGYERSLRELKDRGLMRG
jgi:dTDP-L-rhamnose 4-epimerase